MPRPLRSGAPRRSLLLLALVSAFVLPLFGACRVPQAYEGERRPENEVAQLSVRYDIRGTDIWVERMDGRRQELESGSTVEILPGQHALEGRARGFGQPTAGAPFRIEFLARAGEAYTLVLDQPNRSERLLIAVEDDATGDPVADLEIWP